MTTLDPVTSGDKGDTRTVTLGTVDDAGTFTPANLTTVSSVRTIVKQGGTSAVLTTVVVTPATGIIRFATGTASDAWLPAGPNPGNWSTEYECTYGDGSVLTWPTRGGQKDTIQVLADHD